MDIYGYYALLGVSENASIVDIKRSYRKLVKKYHPDKNRDPYSQDTIKLINIAYEVLSDRTKREKYTQIRFNTNPTDIWSNDTEINQYFETESESKVESKYSETSFENDTQSSESYLLDTQKNRFKITVEPTLCIAFGSCETLAPHVFYVEKDKIFNPKAIVKSETGDNFESIYDAAQTCPTKAIKIIDRFTGQQIYP
ncbi:MAG: hypothetical protein DA328_06415 [Nitrososphaeraceae archaeon]|nr:hypothetical protein [Nitrososphaeraceae archaeon]